MSSHKLHRRALLLSAGALAACGDDTVAPAEDPPEVESPVFRHGVASGDPLPDAVILWTRVTLPDTPEVEVEWVVATDPELADEVQRGAFTTSAERDFTVKVDVAGLTPGTTYYYRFAVGEDRSVRGRTRTAPLGSVPRLRFGVVSCAKWTEGYFHAYRALAAQPDLDAVVHLGDYIYEGGNKEAQIREYDPPHECITVDDYRRRYALYRTDPDLKEVHRQHPFIVVWDDHETSNDSWSEGAGGHDEPTEGSWSERKAGAARVYAEWLPIREQGDPLKIWRVFSFGDLVDLVMLDTRLWARTEPAEGEDDPHFADEERTLLGADQETWLGERLRTSTAAWTLIGQQVMLGRLPQFLNVDQWDGYPAARERFFDLVETEATGGVVVLTGDIHTSFAMDLPRDPEGPNYDSTTGAGSLAVELVVPAVSQDVLTLDIGNGLEGQNPWMKFVDTIRRGFVVLDVTPDRVQAAFTLLDAIDVEESATATMAAAMATYRGAPHLVDDGVAAAPRADAPALAPGPVR